MYIWMFILVGLFGRGDDTVGSPHLTQMSQFELFELILLLKLGKRSPVEQWPAGQFAAAQSPPLDKL